MWASGGGLSQITTILDQVRQKWLTKGSSRRIERLLATRIVPRQPKARIRWPEPPAYVYWFSLWEWPYRHVRAWCVFEAAMGICVHTSLRLLIRKHISSGVIQTFTFPVHIKPGNHLIPRRDGIRYWVLIVCTMHRKVRHDVHGYYPSLPWFPSLLHTHACRFSGSRLMISDSVQSSHYHLHALRDSTRGIIEDRIQYRSSYGRFVLRDDCACQSIICRSQARHPQDMRATMWSLWSQIGSLRFFAVLSSTNVLSG